ncbi:MAG: hypothetical protein QM697_17445 [Lachnospiraceae bacterium]
MIGSRSMRKRISLLIIAAATGAQLSGCGLTSEVSVPEEESGLIAEYAAGLLLKYDSKHEIKLEKIKEEETAEEEDGTDETPEETVNATHKELATAAAVPVDSAVPLGEAMGLVGFDVTYQNYEVCDIYPEEAPGDMFFSMQASPGKDLMIAHFNLTNTSESEQLCEMVNNNTSFRLLINGSERINAQTTILLNDLKQYQDAIAGYGMVDVVLVFEIAQDAQNNFQTLQLLVEDAGTENTYTLQ